MFDRIGFMQGRLSDQIDGKIQAFPWPYWEYEFQAAEVNGFRLIEWTLDHDGLHENPLMTSVGQTKIRNLSQRYSLSIPSLTGDCFMYEPFWKAKGLARSDLQSDFLAICKACANLGIRIMVVPLVDSGRLENTEQEAILIDFLSLQQSYFMQRDLKVIIESDFSPDDLGRFIEKLPMENFGINYDIGNSAAMGFNPTEEFSSYGQRILNVHVKDRILGGPTVPLGAGNADFELVFSALSEMRYKGNYILQTARADDGNHAQVLNQYREMTHKWIQRYSVT